jgi:hypothetical protein
MVGDKEAPPTPSTLLVGDESVNSEQLPVNSEEKLVTDNWSLITENTDNCLLFTVHC